MSSSNLRKSQVFVVLLIVLLVSSCAPVSPEFEITRKMYALGHQESIEIGINGDFLNGACYSMNEIFTLEVTAVNIPAEMIGTRYYRFDMEVFSYSHGRILVALTSSDPEISFELPSNSANIQPVELFFRFGNKDMMSARLYVDEYFPLFEYLGMNERGEFCFAYPSLTNSDLLTT